MGVEAREQILENARKNGAARRDSGQTPSRVRAARSAVEDEDDTPSLACGNRAGETPSPSVENIVDRYMCEDDEDITDACVEGEEKMMVPRKASKAEAKKSASAKKIRPKSTPRQRATTSRSSSAAKRRRGKQGASNSSEDDDKRAFEEWKKKEEEQWALIKNMRKRQEAALREAEGERERVSHLYFLYVANMKV